MWRVGYNAEAAETAKTVPNKSAAPAGKENACAVGIGILLEAAPVPLFPLLPLLTQSLLAASINSTKLSLSGLLLPTTPKLSGLTTGVNHPSLSIPTVSFCAEGSVIEVDKVLLMRVERKSSAEGRLEYFLERTARR